MYTKQELIENKKMEKILRANKYRTRELKNKKEKKEKIITFFEKLYCVTFWSFMVYFIYQVVVYLYIRL